MIYLSKSDNSSFNSSFLYIPVPKIACTSLKHFFYEIKYGTSFPLAEHREKFKHIHKWSKSQLFNEWQKNPLIQNKDSLNLAFKFCIVRDPIERVLSCYKNRVVYHKDLRDLDSKLFENANLKIEPDLNFFIDHLEEYMSVHSGIKHHARSIIDYLGPDPKFYDSIYDISEIYNSLYPRLLTMIPKTDFKIKRLQSSDKISSLLNTSLSASQTDQLQQLYHMDYMIYGDYFKSKYK